MKPLTFWQWMNFPNKMWICVLYYNPCGGISKNNISAGNIIVLSSSEYDLKVWCSIMNCAFNWTLCSEMVTICKHETILHCSSASLHEQRLSCSHFGNFLNYLPLIGLCKLQMSVGNFAISTKVGHCPTFESYTMLYIAYKWRVGQCITLVGNQLFFNCILQVFVCEIGIFQAFVGHFV